MTRCMRPVRPIAKAQAAVRCGASDKGCNAGDGRDWLTEGRVLLPSCGVARSLWYSYHGAARALPEGKIIPVQRIISGGRWYKLLLLSVLSVALSAITASAGPAPLASPPESNLPLQKVYVFGKDDRIAVPEKFAELKHKIGLVYSANTRHGCTASCVAKDVILTAAHCVLSKRSRKSKRVETSGVQFILPSKHLKGQFIVADVLHPADYTPRNVISGFPVTRAQTGGGKAKDWAFVKLSSNACRYGSLPLRALPAAELQAASKTGKLMEVAFHGDRDYGKTLLYTDKCKLRGFGKRRKRKSAPVLIKHRCDLTSGASGSPLLVNTPEGPVIAALNVAEFATQRYLRRGRKIIKYYRKKPSHNLAINVSVFQDKLEHLTGIKVVNTKNALERIQTGLKLRRLYKGKVDGIFGPATWSALRKFERQQKRGPLGLPTSALLKELEQPSQAPES